MYGCGDVENPQKVSIGRPSDCPVYGSRLHSTRHQQQDSENKVGLMYNIVDQLIDLKYVPAQLWFLNPQFIDRF